VIEFLVFIKFYKILFLVVIFYSSVGLGILYEMPKKFVYYTLNTVFSYFSFFSFQIFPPNIEIVFILVRFYTIWLKIDTKKNSLNKKLESILDINACLENLKDTEFLCKICDSVMFINPKAGCKTVRTPLDF
jgi:hypothetical protein